MSSPSLLGDFSILDEIAELSYYEDALDENDHELRTLVEATEIQISKAETRLKRPKPLNILSSTIPASSSTSLRQSPPHQHSSSSEHSSIERIGNDGQPHPVRSRRSTGNRRKRVPKSGGSSTSNGNGAEPKTPEEWKMMNYAFQEAAAYPILFQLNQQLQLISSQMQEIQATNALQLRLIYRITKTVLMCRRRTWFSPIKSVSFWTWLFFLSWPFLIQFLYRLYKSKRHQLALAWFKYL
uniref:Uncharacterized protein n=1 Tax=Acrobeloides nanus TaxID=290746 RepID=A0A914C2D9_9BILA